MWNRKTGRSRHRYAEPNNATIHLRVGDTILVSAETDSVPSSNKAVVRVTGDATDQYGDGVTVLKTEAAGAATVVARPPKCVRPLVCVAPIILNLTVGA